MNAETSDSQSQPLKWLMRGNRAALMVVSLFVVGIIAVVVAGNLPEQEMCCLFDNFQPTFAEQNRILAALGATELTDYCEKNGQIMVPANQKGKFLAVIAEKGAMPEALIGAPEFQPNPFLPRSQLEQQRLAQKTKKVCEMIKQLPFVADAQLEFDREESGNLFQPQQQSAVVMITPNENRILNRQQLQSIQRTVASSFVSIQADEVAVVDIHAGIAWDDIRGQTELIELVNWELKRRKHYERLLYSELTPEFPGIEISVRVHATVRQAKQDQDGPQKVFKLAAETAQQSPTNQARAMELNTTKRVTVVPPEILSTHQDSEVQTTSFEAELPHATREIEIAADSSTEPYEVELNVKVIVPNAPFNSTISVADSSQTPAERFQLLSNQIAAKVHSKLPPELLTGSYPVEIVPRQQLVTNCGDCGPVVDFLAIQKFWPLWAVLLTGIGAAVLIRNQNRSAAAAKTSSAAAPNPSVDLEKQLSELIESDPVTAAKVLKNWIQDH